MMSRGSARIAVAAVMSTSLLVASAASGEATTPDTVANGTAATTSETAPDTTPPTAAFEVLPPDEPWSGMTRGEWNALGWQRVVSMPGSFAPVGDQCGLGQFGPMFFLTGTFGATEQTCVVAEGTAIFVVVTGAECSTIEPPPYFGRTEEELRACAAAAVDEITQYEARVDGRAVSNLDEYRTTSPLFTFTLPENNDFGLEPGVANAVAESYSFIVAPPPPGEYEISWSTTFPGETEPLGGTVTIIVEAPRVIEPAGLHRVDGVLRT
jgi:hypothetical protein